MTEKELEFRRVNVRLTPELYEKLASNAKRRGFSIQAMTVMAIEEYLKDSSEEKK